MARGGKRKGAGRKKGADPTVTIRVPNSKKEIIKHWIETGGFQRTKLFDHKAEEVTEEVLTILQDALSLKANAGGKIKKEIRLAIDLVQKSSNTSF